MKDEQGLTTRDSMIKMFLQTKDAVISGEALSQTLGLSRTAIWKQIKQLESYGFRFEATTRVGYRVVHVPDELMQPLITPYLPANATFGHSVLWAPARASTNDDATQLARTGAPTGVVITAGEQTGGRGRQGRNWTSPAGGMWFSVIVRTPCALSQAAELTLLASVAVRRALVACGSIDVEIKWPNDILVNGKKVCGILAQMRTDAEQVDYAVIGIGINANFANTQLPNDILARATTLQTELGHPIERPKLLADILSSLETLYTDLQTGAGGFHTVRDEWKDAAHTLNRKIQVKVGDDLLSGVATDVDEQGILYLHGDDGQIHRIHSGEVLFSAAEEV
ncbi:biotin--[acetyl-CoA-carboxylase] ligase [Alicyclobacillus fodiniaquatilis]|uniref:Bifunctional ligase/repressor BirA n=1 Tax=Alicyclobacillus fodiniaquatilis TaxID=1661150 RepID=A0ABW4JEL8_9BACL